MNKVARKEDNFGTTLIVLMRGLIKVAATSTILRVEFVMFVTSPNKDKATLIEVEANSPALSCR